jgi:hypothetical protein
LKQRKRRNVRQLQQQILPPQLIRCISHQQNEARENGSKIKMLSWRSVFSVGTHLKQNKQEKKKNSIHDPHKKSNVNKYEIRGRERERVYWWYRRNASPTSLCAYIRGVCTRSLCCSTQICLHVSCCFFFLFYSLSYLLKQKKKKEKRTAPAWLTSLVREAHYLHRKRTNKKHTPALSAIDFDTSLEREETVCCVPFLIRSSRTPPGGQTPDAVKRTVQQVRIQHSSPFFLDLFQ